MIDSFTNDVLMAIIGAIFGEPNFDHLTLSIGDGVVLYGKLLTTIVNFLLIAFALFLVVKAFNSFRRKEDPEPQSTGEGRAPSRSATSSRSSEERPLADPSPYAGRMEQSSDPLGGRGYPRPSERDRRAWSSRATRRAAAGIRGRASATVEVSGRLRHALAAIDAANADDPNHLIVRGVERPKELAHAELVTEWLGRLDPDASEALLLAGRAHHVRRWEIPRSSYPEGRSGYLRWRRALHDLHANEVERILTDVGYDTATRGRVADLVRKRGLGRDPEAQALEDALCLVFLETQLLDLAARVEHEKMVDVLVKSMLKMSERGIELALTIDLPPDATVLLEEAAGRLS